MGYTLTIGQKIKNNNIQDIIDDAKEDGYEPDIESREFEAKTESSDNAPAFGEPTDYMNQRWPTYTSWYTFLYTAELNNIFLDDNDRLKGEHPGYINITEEIYNEIKEKYTLFKMRYRTAVPSFDIESEQNVYSEGYKSPANHVLARFEWLIYWLDYSMKKYDEVVLSNT